MADRSQGSCLWSRRRPFSSMRPQRTLLLCRSIPTIIFIVVLRLVVGLSLLTHLKLLTRLPDNHVLLKRQLTLNVLQHAARQPTHFPTTMRSRSPGPPRPPRRRPSG